MLTAVRGCGGALAHAIADLRADAEVLRREGEDVPGSRACMQEKLSLTELTQEVRMTVTILSSMSILI